MERPLHHALPLGPVRGQAHGARPKTDLEGSVGFVEGIVMVIGSLIFLSLSLSRSHNVWGCLLSPIAAPATLGSVGPAAPQGRRVLNRRPFFPARP